MTDSWRGKTAIITGAGTGIGRAVSKELAGRGAIVYVTAITLDEANAVVADINAAGGTAIPVKVDVTVNAEVEGVIERVVAERGVLDLMMNNAGMLFIGEYFDMDEAYLEKMVQVNITAMMIGTLYAYRVMKEQRHGLIVNVASQGGLMAVGTMAAYSATKHAIVGLGESVGGEAKDTGVQLKTVCPGNVQSNLMTAAKKRGTTAEKVLAMLPEVMPAETAAKIIVDGFSSKKYKIIFPWYSKVLYAVVRLWPGFGRVGAADSITKFRQARTEENQH